MTRCVQEARRESGMLLHRVSIVVKTMLASILIVVAGACGSAQQRIDEPVEGVSTTTTAASVSSPETIAIDVTELLPTLEDKSQSDVDDQLLDWAVYGTMQWLGHTPEAIARATHAGTPVRFA